MSLLIDLMAINSRDVKRNFCSILEVGAVKEFSGKDIPLFIKKKRGRFIPRGKRIYKLSAGRLT